MVQAVKWTSCLTFVLKAILIKKVIKSNTGIPIRRYSEMIPARLIISDSGPIIRMKTLDNERATKDDIPAINRLKMKTTDITFTTGTKEILKK